MTILKGYERKQGNFTNKVTGEVIEYDNIVIHYESDEREEVQGFFCGSAKCKAKGFKIYGAKDIHELLNKEIILAMDPTANAPTVNAIYAVSPPTASGTGGR